MTEQQEYEMHNAWDLYIAARDAMPAFTRDGVYDAFVYAWEKKVKLEDWCSRVEDAVDRFIAGESLSEDETHIEGLLKKFRESEAISFPAQDGSTMPPLSISYGSSGLEVRALLDKSYNCVDHYTGKNIPQQVMIAPWIQFQPAELSQERLRLVTEICRRAMMYDAMVKELASKESAIESFREGDDRRREETDRLVELWRAERVQYGKPADFSDIK